MMIGLKATEEELAENKKRSRGKGPTASAAAAKSMPAKPAKPAKPPMPQPAQPVSPGEPSPNPAPMKRVKGKQTPAEQDHARIIQELQEATTWYDAIFQLVNDILFNAISSLRKVSTWNHLVHSRV